MPRAEAKYTLKADDRTAEGLNSAESRLSRFRRRSVLALSGAFNRVRGAVAGIGAAMIGWGASLVQATGQLDELAKKAKDLNASVEEMAEAQLAGELLGTSPGKVIRWFEQIQSRAFDATNGLKDAQETFAELGIDAAALQKLGVEDTFVAVAEALGRIEDPGRRIGLRRRVGATGREAGRVFGGGGRRVIEAFGEAERLGVGRDLDEAAVRAEELADAWAKFAAVGRNLKGRMLGSEAAIAALDAITERMAQLGGQDTRGFVDLTASAAARGALRDPTTPKERTQQQQLDTQRELVAEVRRLAVGYDR